MLQRLSGHRGHLLIFILASVVVVGWLLLAPVDFPLHQPVTINAGVGTTGISQELGAAHVVQSPLFFQLITRLTRSSTKLQAGDYWFEQRINMLEVLRRLRNGRYIVDPVKVTIPEGLRPAEVATLVSNKFPALSPLELAEALKPEPESAFPDTYFLPQSATAPELLLVWRQRWALETGDLQKLASNRGQSWHDTVTLASIIEEEASNAVDRRLIAGILERRLAAKMPLQVDVAPETYDHLGLPDQAISNMSLDALDAALNPSDSQYWYYLSDREGVTHYATTFAEHKQNRQKYLP